MEALKLSQIIEFLQKYQQYVEDKEVHFYNAGLEMHHGPINRIEIRSHEGPHLILMINRSSK